MKKVERTPRHAQHRRSTSGHLDPAHWVKAWQHYVEALRRVTEVEDESIFDRP